MSPRQTSIFLTVTLCACASTPTRGTRAHVSDPAPALAGPASAHSQQAQAGTPEPWTVTLKATSYAESDFDDVNAELEVTRVGADVRYKMPVDSGVWNFRFGVEDSQYDVGSFGSFDDGTEVGFGGTYIHPGPEWSWFATLNLNEGTGDGADFADGTYFEGGGGFTYAVNEKLKLGLALLGRTQLEEDAEVFPFPIIEWEISDRSRIGFVRSSDPSLGWTYKVNDELDYYVQVQQAQRQYRLDEDVLDDAAFVDEEIGLRTGVIYRDPSGFTGEVYLGAAQRTLFLDVNDDEVLEEDIETAAFFGVAVSFGF